MGAPLRIAASGAAGIDPVKLHQACGLKPSNACRWAFEQTSSVGWAKAADFLLSKPLHILVILVVAYLLNRVVRHSVNRFTARLAGVVRDGGLQRMVDRAPAMLAPTGELNLRSEARARTVAAVLKSLSTAVIYTFAVVYVVAELGLQLGPLIAGAGIAGIALGFGAQSLVRDFLSGIFILVEDQYGVGDIIDVGGPSGTVEAVSLRTTRLRDVNGTVWHVPNGEIRRVGNKSQEWARAVLDLTLAYDTDVVAAQSFIAEESARVCAGADVAGQVLEPPEVWGVEDLGPDGIVVRVVVKTQPGDQFVVMRKLRQGLVESLGQEGFDLGGAAGHLYVRKDQADQAVTDAKATTEAAKPPTRPAFPSGGR